MKDGNSYTADFAFGAAWSEARRLYERVVDVKVADDAGEVIFSRRLNADVEDEDGYLHEEAAENAGYVSAAKTLAAAPRLAVDGRAIGALVFAASRAIAAARGEGPDEAAARRAFAMGFITGANALRCFGVDFAVEAERRARAARR